MGESGELGLSGTRSLEWQRPAKVAQGLNPQTVVCGKGDPGLALEVASAHLALGITPTREGLAALHKARLNNRQNPVVVTAIGAGNAWLFGPNPQGSVVGPMPIEHAQRLLQTGLDEPNGPAARQRISALLDAMAASSTNTTGEDFLPGVANSGLFATHELRTGVRSRSDWEPATNTAMPLLGMRREELVKALGFTTTDATGQALLLSGVDADHAVAVLLEEGEAFDADSTRFQVSPVAYGLFVAQQRKVPWVMLLRGSQIRLYPARPEVGVGRKGLAETYFELDLALVTPETAGYLGLIFTANALADGGTTSQILASSAQYAVRLGARLRDRVYDDIIPELSVHVGVQLAESGVDLDREGLDRAYRLTLRIFFRMLFQAYAEDRKLLPYGENERYTRNALKTMAADLASPEEDIFDPESSSMWDDLMQVWRVIDKGDKAWGVPPYNGGLFSSDAELHPESADIDQLSIPNSVIGPALRALLIDDDDEGTRGPVDFRTLGVREFGTIYEGLLESSLGLAETNLTVDEKDTWVPAKPGDEIVARKGWVYFHNTSGQRKGTGSYFTPTFVVEHLLERALDPALDAHLAKVAALLKAGDQSGAADMFFDFRIADLAMGSGHFLTAAIDHCEQAMASFLEEYPVPGVNLELQLLEDAAREASGPDAPEPERSSLLRRQIARRCIYGLDINPISVELARVSIWIHTFVRGLPMSSLDHNLVCANSLTGIGTVDEALDVLVPMRKGQLTIFDDPIKDALDRARTVLVDVSRLAEIDRKEAQAASRAVKKAREEAQTARLLFDAAVLTRIGRQDLVDGVDPMKMAEKAAGDEAQSVLKPLQPGHMPVLFPEVFLRDNPGFDVLVGNPPWEEVMVEEPKFWLRVSPGLLGMNAKDMKSRISSLRLSRPEMLVEMETEIERVAQLRKVLLAGPFPGLGTGDIDLYRVFAWRNWSLLRADGSLACVFPRTLLNSAGSAPWREETLGSGDVSVVTVTNTGNWVFTEVDGRYSIVLVQITKSSSPAGVVRIAGPFHDRQSFSTSSSNFASIDVALIRSSSSGAAFPQLPTTFAAEVFAQLRESPRLDSPDHAWSFRPVREFDATNDRPIFDAGVQAPGRWPVYGGSSSNIWQPETGEYYTWADPKKVIASLQDKRVRQIRLKSSAFFGMDPEWAADAETLPCMFPRIGFRDVTRSTDTRTVIAALVPGERVLTNSSPYLLRAEGSPTDDAWVLGIMCSIPLDWYARRFVELHLNFHILNGLPIPHCDPDDPRRVRVANIAGRLAARDERFADWAEEVGAPVGSVKTPEEQAELEAELDALVASLYGLSAKQLTHIFETFHRGWDYKPRLERVLGYFEKIEVK